MESEKLLYLFDRLEQSYIGEAIRNSIWMFPVIEATHLIGLAILGGSILVVDLRLLGLLLSSKPIQYVIKQTTFMLKLGLIVIVSTGIPLFLSEAIKCYYSRAFWIKMSALILGLIFLFFIYSIFSNVKSVNILINFNTSLSSVFLQNCKYS